jgi:hypothetical protein
MVDEQLHSLALAVGDARKGSRAERSPSGKTLPTYGSFWLENSEP